MSGVHQALLCAGEIDSYFESVKLLLHMNGSNGGTSFPDSSLTTKTISRVGSGVTTQTANPKYGSAAAGGFNGSSALTVANHADLSLGSSDFTIEAWVYVTTLASQSLMVHGNVATPDSQKSFFIYTSGSGVWQCYFYNLPGGFAAFNTASAVFSANQWHHFALTRSGSTLRAFINGVLGGTISMSAASGVPVDSLYIGNYNGLADPLQGFIDEVRITVGVARYTAAFTPPTSQFADK